MTRRLFAVTPPGARALAESLVATGKANGVRTQALITAMHAPLGRAVGNALEVKECLEILRCGKNGALESLSVALAARMVLMLLFLAIFLIEESLHFELERVERTALLCDVEEDQQAEIPHSSFDSRKVSSVDSQLRCELLLTQFRALPLTFCANAFSHDLQPLVAGPLPGSTQRQATRRPTVLPSQVAR